MFEPEEQPASAGQPEQEEGSVLQRFLSQLGMPAGSGPNDLNSLGLQTADPQSRGLLDGPRLPRYYGAPPDHLPPSDLTPYSKVTPGDATDRVKFMLQRASAPAQPSGSPVNNPYSHNSSSGIGSLLSRSSFARPEASDNSYRPDVSAYLAPTLNLVFRGNSPSAPTLPSPLGGPPMPASLPDNRASVLAGKPSSSSPVDPLGSKILSLTAGSKTNTNNAPLPANTPDGLANGKQFSATSRVPSPADQNVTDPVTGGKLPPDAAKPADTNIGEAVARAGTAAAGGNAVGKTITAGGQPKKNEGSSLPMLKGKVGRPGAGADNQPEDVKVVQQLLNAALDNGDLAGKKLPEDGKVTPQMLKMIDDYQNQHIRGVQPDQPDKPGTSAKIRLIDQKSSTLKQLKQNPFADERWNRYDDIIKEKIATFNKKFSNSGVDWQLVKAMLWQESGGPDKGIEWTIWPMQIGRRQADKAINDVISGKNHTKLIATPEERKEIADKFHQHRMTPELNIKAGIIYLLARKIESTKNVTDSGMTNKVMVRRGDTLEGLAGREGTTEEQLLIDHPELKTKPLQPGELLYSKAHREPEKWSDQKTALHNYNSEVKNKHYADQVLKKYDAIKRRWPQ